ncbi:MAG: hypothetical protein Q9P01_11880 [Anaerolineae bacterium]|nr:hypothetical protein [Anaerolineae bacterium]MDQ7035498.1 hypothetical protein [Anaerolineae bacterium]
MADKSIKAFHQEVQGKIKRLLTEFGEGKISSEQFNILYARYSNQLDMARSVLEGEEERTTPGSNISTIAIRAATTGKALGLAIYHHRSGMIIETLGTFDLSADIISPTLNEFSDKLDKREFIEPKTKKLTNGLWVVFMARRFTTAIVIFRNEPAPRQVKELERLQHAFEEANHHNLDKMDVDKSKLAKPFLNFVRRKLSS